MRKRRYYYASEKTLGYIDYLLSAFGFRYRETGRAYLAVRFKGYKTGKLLPSDLADTIIEELKKSIIAKGYNRTNNLGRIEKKNNCFSATDLADYIFCPYKIILKFKGFSAQKKKAAEEGIQSHKEENILKHIDILKRRQKNIFKRWFLSSRDKFSQIYENFIKENLFDSELIYSSEQTRELLTYSNLGGKPDYIFFTPQGNILIELKFSYLLSGTIYKSYKIQMYCYALLAQKNGIDVKRGFLIKYPKDKAQQRHPIICQPIEFKMNEVYAEVMRINDELSQVVKDMRLQKRIIVNLNKCVKCAYMYFCNVMFYAAEVYND
jgi:CRISPR/Cas system-associated exonuclease Cas4 (RecB family)